MKHRIGFEQNRLEKAIIVVTIFADEIINIFSLTHLHIHRKPSLFFFSPPTSPKTTTYVTAQPDLAVKPLHRQDRTLTHLVLLSTIECLLSLSLTYSIAKKWWCAPPTPLVSLTPLGFNGLQRALVSGESVTGLYRALVSSVSKL